jgi:hypothetical protein
MSAHHVLAVLLPALACGASPGHRTSDGQLPEAGPLSYRLEANDGVAGSPVELRFTLTNLSSQNIWVLTWYTPLEGLKGKILRVTRNGEELAYEGRMVKRGAAQPEDYVSIEQGGTVRGAVDLSQSYDLTQSGDYRVEFVGRIHDLVHEPVRSPRKQDEHRSVDISGTTATFHLKAP